MNTSVWSAIWCGFVRKKNARVMWKSERDVRIVAADISAIFGFFLVAGGVRKRRREVGSWCF